MARSRFLRAGRLRRSCRVRRPWLGQSPDSRNAGAAVVHNFVEGRYRRVRLKSLKSIVTEGAGELTWDVETRLAGWFTARRTTAGESLSTSVPRHYPVLGLGHYPSPYIVQRTSPVTHGLPP